MSLPKGNNKTDKTRQYQNQFAKERYKTAACKVSIKKYELFQEYAQKRGKTVSGALLAYIDSCISAAGKDPGADPVE